MGEQTTLMNSIALATINAVRAEVAHVSDTGLPLDVFPAKVQEIILDLAAEDNYPVENTQLLLCFLLFQPRLGTLDTSDLNPHGRAIPVYTSSLLVNQGKARPLPWTLPISL